MSDESGVPPAEEKKPIPVFRLSSEEDEFEVVKRDPDAPLYELLDPHNILLFIDEEHFRMWIWQGSESRTRGKFISAKKAPNIRDKYGIALRITSVDGGDEPLAFQILVGLKQAEEVLDFKAEGPSYTGTTEDLDLLDNISLENIIAVLDKDNLELPEGYKRVMVVVGRQIYGYQVQKKMVLGTVVEEKKLYPLHEQVPDGPYLAEGFVPRMLFSFNNVVLVELLQKIQDGA